MGPGTETAWQHDGRMLPDGEITFFDDGSNPPDPQPVARRADRARLQDPRSAPRLGLHAPQPAAARRQPGQHADARRTGTRVVGYGGVPAISEFAADGSLLFDAHLPLRHGLLPGLPLPLERAPAEPAGGARQPQQHRRRDDRARQLERRDRSRLLARARGRTARARSSAQATIAASGFESSTILPKKYAYAAVQALDSAGQVLGTSHTVQVISYTASLPSPDGRMRSGDARCRERLGELRCRRLEPVATLVAGLVECLCGVVVVVVAGVLVAGWRSSCSSLSPPHPATASVAASVASSVSMAVSDVRLIGRPPVRRSRA